MSINVSNCQHCDDRTTISNTVMCTLNDFLGITVRFIHTSTVTGSDSFSRKKKKLRVRFAYILLLLQYYTVINLCTIGVAEN